MINLEKRIDAAIINNVVPDEYFSIWEELGRWQLELLISLGLTPNNTLLDFGCGALRFGLYGIDYLNNNNYFGVDVYEPYVKTGLTIAAAASIKKQFKILTGSYSNFEDFNVKFDFGIAQSVFTHMTGKECSDCVENLIKVMKPKSIFVFTYLIGKPSTIGMLYLGNQPMRRFSENDESFFSSLASKYNIEYERINYSHPTGQSVSLFRF